MMTMTARILFITGLIGILCITGSSATMSVFHSSKAAPKGTPVGDNPCSNCERFVVIMKALAAHRYTGRVGAIVKVADEQLCEDLEGSFEKACKSMVDKHSFDSIPHLADRVPSVFCEHLGKCGAVPETAEKSSNPEISETKTLKDKQAAGDLLLSVYDEDDEDEDGEISRADVQAALEDFAKSRILAENKKRRTRRRRRRVVRKTVTTKTVTRRTTRRKRGKRGKKRSRRRRKSKSRKGRKRRRRRRRRSKKKKSRLPKDYGYELAKHAYKVHKSATSHWQKMMALHEMAMLTGSQSPISTSGIDMNADLYRPDSHTMDTFSDGSSINQDLGEGHHGDDDDNDEMTQGAYDDPWLVSIHPGLARERMLTAGDGLSGKRDLKSWLANLQKRIALGNPAFGVHSYGMGMNQGGVLGTMVGAQ